MKRSRIFIVALVVTVVLLIGGYLGAGAVIYNRLSSVQSHCGNNSDDNQNSPTTFAYTSASLDPEPYQMGDFEEVSFPSRGNSNIVIQAWLVPAPIENPAEAPAVILVHGLNGCRRSEHILTAAGMLHRNGFNTLLIDLRDMGDSTIEDARFSAGTDEHLDVLGSWDYLITDRGFAPERVGILGMSLGAASVMIAAGEETGIAALWEDSGFADINEVIQAELVRNNYPTFLSPGGVLMGQLISGDNIGAYSPLAAMYKLDGRSIYITHGDADERLSVEYAYQLANAVRADGGTVEPWIVPGMGHTMAVIELPDEYERRLVEFFSTSLGATTEG